ncbi:hypothetical protein CSUI_010361 [Cystoisospora suis]|uniref:Multidrug resistance protein MdtA-like barrel-sandwich hybrid domain-containing protein n=1 Tax=Cystoisospora suis TaxID=483139 RepID=A0A2C6KE73_9APIC|nr:hypothetical protein CSUI_010361 [Cystoisospora suis]
MKEDTLGTNTPGTDLRCYSSSSFSFLQGKKNSHPLLRPFLGRVREAETTSLFSPPPPLPQHLREERRRFMHQDTSTSSRSSHEEEEGETDMLEIPLGSVTDGKVVRVSIKEGQLVTKDEVLMRLTCCENVEVLIRAPFRGVVASIGVREGDVIQRGHIIAVLIPQSLDH